MNETTPPCDRSMDVLNRFCLSRSVLRDVTGRWAPLVLLALDENAPARFGDLHRAVDGCSERMLSQTLRTLTDDGFVTRGEEHGHHPVYGLTDGGRTLVPHLRGLRDALYAHLTESSSE
ncbi:MAG: winged helix-turn-helix transcriptional regulator [Mycobacteriaceae bacterium]|uniref:winged helix-turn-helix transcriptional regulator n=1 Tax=Corynebacterium sp. TaxID=1720 RepID=UPI003F9A2738